MSNEQNQNAKPEITRSPQWRVIYTNVVSVGFGENEARIGVGFDNDLAKPNSSLTEEAVVVMPHRAAKLIAFTLNAMIANWEAAHGVIPMSQDKVEEIEAMLRAQPLPQRK
jgi:hypothetical protein